MIACETHILEHDGMVSRHHPLLRLHLFQIAVEQMFKQSLSALSSLCILFGDEHILPPQVIFALSTPQIGSQFGLLLVHLLLPLQLFLLRQPMLNMSVHVDTPKASKH